MGGRWMSPDPYSGSYDLANPQSFNRYTYVTNNPLSFTDPSGLIDGSEGCIGGPWGCVIGIAAAAFFDHWLFGGGPSFHGSLHPRPTTGDPNWDGNFGESLGIGTKVPRMDLGIAAALGLPDAGCDFGACGGVQGDSLEPRTATQITLSSGPSLGPSLWMFGYLARQEAAVNKTLNGLTKGGFHFACGPNKASRILKSARNGAFVGAVTGGYRGFVAGEAAGGAESGGLSGLPGAAAGAATGGTLGMGSGLSSGYLFAVACENLGAYND